MMLSISIMSAGVPVASIKAYSTQTERGLSEWIHCLLYGESPCPGNNSSHRWNSCEVRSLLWLLSLSASLLLSARLGSLWITPALQIEVQTYKGQTFLLIFSRLNTLATGIVKVASKEHQQSENVGEVRRDLMFGVVCRVYICMCVCGCLCVVFECMWLLRLSSVQALKVGPDFTVISHPNGSCHILLPTHGWRTTKSQEEKRKLNRHSICLLLSQNKSHSTV